jgi:hypothetical protein
MEKKAEGEGYMSSGQGKETRFRQLGQDKEGGRPTLVHQLEGVIESAKGAAIRDIFRILNKAIGRTEGEEGKVTIVKNKDGQHLCEPEGVRNAAAKHGKATLAAGVASPDVVRGILKEISSAREEGGESEKGDWLRGALKWQNFQRALRNVKHGKG